MYTSLTLTLTFTLTLTVTLTPTFTPSLTLTLTLISHFDNERVSYGHIRIRSPSVLTEPLRSLYSLSSSALHDPRKQSTAQPSHHML